MVRIDIPQTGPTNIARLDSASTIENDVIAPKISNTNSEINIPFWELVNEQMNLSPACN